MRQLTPVNHSRNIWVYVELERETKNSKGRIKKVSLELLSAGRKLADDMQGRLTAVLIGYHTKTAVSKLSQYDIEEILVMDDGACRNYHTLRYTAVFCNLIEKYNPYILLIGATGNGRDMAPRIACRLRTGLTADCTGIFLDFAGEQDKETVTWRRPALGGNLMADIVCMDKGPQMGTVRPGVFMVDLRRASVQGPQIIRENSTDAAAIRVPELLTTVSHCSKDTLSIENADIIVAAGRGMESAENMRYVKELAAVLGGAVGVSRAAADDGWYEHHNQIGQSGKTVRPKLYIACGISGAVQHIAGMKEAQMIIAINKDLSAPIMRLADYALIGDALKIIPSVIKKIKGE